jgi:hypothetical protein
MKRFVWSALLAVAAFPAFAQDTTFNPKVTDVCVPSHTGGFIVDRKRLIARLIQVQAGVPAIDLRPDGQPVTSDMQVQALLQPEAFCKINGCSAATVTKLQGVYFVLMEFLTANSGMGTKSFRLAGSTNPNDFLGAPEGTLNILCAPPPKQQAQGAEPGKSVAEKAQKLLRRSQECRGLGLCADGSDFHLLQAGLREQAWYR